jgi:hypothetical protein
VKSQQILEENKMGRMPVFKYFDKRKGGIIMEAQRLPSIQRRYDLPFVSLEIMNMQKSLDDPFTYEYRVWGGNEKRINLDKRFPVTMEGLEDAIKEFNRHYTDEMAKPIDYSGQEIIRLTILEGKKPEFKNKIGDKQKQKRQLQLRKLLGDMLEKNQIDKEKLLEIFDSLK